MSYDKVLHFLGESNRGDYDKEKYAQDFPSEGTFNWKRVKLKTPNDPYYNGRTVLGVVVHDGNFIINGVLFLKDEYEIVDENPLDLK